MWTYSKDRLQQQGQELLDRIQASEILQERWGVDTMDENICAIPFCPNLNQMKPKGQDSGDIELIVTRDAYHDAYPEDVISRFDMDICKIACYFGYGYIIPNPRDSFRGITAINQDRCGFVVNYMIALKEITGLTFQESLKKLKLWVPPDKERIIRESFDNGIGGFFNRHYDNLDVEDWSYNVWFKVTMCVGIARKRIIDESLRIACERTPGNNVALLSSKKYHRITLTVHNNIVSHQIVRFKKYAERNIIISELPQDSFTSSHCKEIYREIDDTYPTIKYYRWFDNGTMSYDTSNDSDDEDVPIHCGIKYWINSLDF